MTIQALDAPELAHPFLSIFFPSLTASPEAGKRFNRPVEVRGFLIRCGLDPKGDSISPREVLERSIGSMAETFETEPPSLDAVWEIFHTDNYLRLENFDTPVPVKEYFRKIAATELSFGRKHLLPNAIVEILLKNVVPPIVGCRL